MQRLRGVDRLDFSENSHFWGKVMISENGHFGGKNEILVNILSSVLKNRLQ